MLNFLLALIAIALFLWYAAIGAGWVSFGTPAVVLGIGLAVAVASRVNWRDRGTTLVP